MQQAEHICPFPASGAANRMAPRTHKVSNNRVDSDYLLLLPTIERRAKRTQRGMTHAAA